MQKIDSLHSWIGQLVPAIRERVVQRMRPRHYGDGEPVYSMGEEGHELYMVESGRVRFCNYTLKGKEIQFGEVRTGDCFGELSLIDSLCRPHWAYAQGATELLVLHRHDFEYLSARYPDINAQLTKLLSRRLRVAYTIIEDASMLPMLDRLARLLARLGYSVGTTDEQGVTVLGGFTHEALARMLGCAREGISRELKRMEDAALIQRHYGKILIPDIAVLIDKCDDMVGGEPIVPGYH